jgi:monoamine oxidase
LRSTEDKSLDTLIIGGGLSGLALAYELERQGRDYRLLEAHPRLGGRILSHAGVDLGAAWFWPGQPHIARLIERLGLLTFEQYATGLALVQRSGQVQAFAPPTERSYRLVGGMQRLVEALSGSLTASRLRLGSRACAVVDEGSHVTVVVEEAGGARQMKARQVVIAAPPRLIAEYLSFSPALPSEFERNHRDSPTWMAGNAKAVIAYATPFWRSLRPALAAHSQVFATPAHAEREASDHRQYLSGTVFSETGPLMEIHDASAADGGQAALFGFFGIDAETRRQHRQTELEQAIIRQLIALFGSAAAQHQGIVLQDWAQESMTATAADQLPLMHHPLYALGPRPQWDGRLIFAGSESALRFGGYLEGALAAGQAALDLLPG